MRGQALLAVAAVGAALAFAQPAQAQYRSYQDEYVARQEQCRQERSNGAVGGAIIGGILGAMFGNNVSGHHHHSDGSIVGGVAGATAGGLIGHGIAADSCARKQRVQGAYDPYYGRPEGGDRYAYRDDDRNNRLDGGPDDQDRYAYNDRDPRDDNSDCRWGEMTTRDPDGREDREQVWMCRDSDGVWRPQER